MQSITVQSVLLPKPHILPTIATCTLSLAGPRFILVAKPTGSMSSTRPLLAQVLDTIYSSSSEDFSASLCSRCITLLGVFLCGGAANAARVYLMQISGKSTRIPIFHDSEAGFFDKTRTGELINRLSANTAVIGHSLTDNLSGGLRGLAQAAAGISMVLFVLPTFYGSKQPCKRPVRHSLLPYRLAEERISNMRTVCAFGKELTEVAKYTEKANYILHLAKQEAILLAGFFGVTGLSGNIIILSVLYKGGLLMATEHITVGKLSSFLMYAFWVGISIAGRLMKGCGAGPRLWEVLDRKLDFPLNEGIVLRPEQLKGNLEFQNVSFAYPTRPSGSGKSTLVSLLLRLYDPDSGVITIDGCGLSLYSVGLQEPVLFSCSIAENIAYGAPDFNTVTVQEIHRAGQIANAYEFVRGLSEGFDTVVGEKGVLLSGGQKQRIAIARALALDAENEFLVQEAMERLMDGRTVLIIAHRLTTIQNADAVLGQRCVVECGQHAQLLGNYQGLFRKLMEKLAFFQEGKSKR
uniref:ATP binding cassette subfamily B member 10 n=1 Tax=Oncorhynchus kisutch TaxID=8019 RepID=A0A8C7L781_ONCKI